MEPSSFCGDLCSATRLWPHSSLGTPERSLFALSACQYRRCCGWRLTVGPQSVAGSKPCTFLQAQLFEQVRELILSGVLKGGVALPPTWCSSKRPADVAEEQVAEPVLCFAAAAVIARANGNPIKLVYVYSCAEWTALVAPAASSMRSRGDLKGKRIAAARDGIFRIISSH